MGPTAATANECWSSGDTGFTSVFRTNSYGDAAQVWGAENNCSFPTAAYAMF